MAHSHQSDGSDESSASESTTRLNRPPVFTRIKTASSCVALHARKHAGVGVICSVAYFDPGNWGVDLQASQYGYKLLFIILLAGLFAAFLQVLATRLGCVTGLDLASHCRILLYDRPKHPRLYRWLGLYPLYAISEIAIVATDLAELLGSAIALCLLFPRLELWHGVLITTFDVVLLLALRDPLRSTPVKMFEIIIALMVMAVLICMVIIITRIHVDWAQAFDGFLPSKDIFGAGPLYTSVGILGATVMPHTLFLGSTLATQDRLGMKTPLETPSLESLPVAEPKETTLKTPSRSSQLVEFFVSLFRAPPASLISRVKRHADRENNTLAFIRAHLRPQIIDMVGSLLGFAVLINAMILVIATATFSTAASGNLFDAYNIIHQYVGPPAATVFAISLLASGQSSSIIATVAGQAVSEGFLNWRVSPVVRRLLTRLIGVIPSMAVAIALGRPGINALLVASQVILSIILPFVTLPLIYFTSSKSIMRVRKSEVPVLTTPSELGSSWDDFVDHSNNLFTTILGGLIWLIMLTANIYVIVTTFIGI
ncbi:natural resistance-associated macrophage protein-domain-containing protein [Mycena galericulata]|nr:natural resistance-associated macrophage protein-domain-containing protein [Mycena galericulata]